MKRWIAIALAALMLFASAAIAENANMLVIADPVLALVNGEETRTVTFTDLQLSLAVGMSADLPTLQLDLDNNDNSLFRLALQIVDNRVVFGAEGVSSCYAVDLTSIVPDDRIGSVLTLAIGSVATLGESYVATLISTVTEVGPNGERVKTIEVSGEQAKAMFNEILDMLDGFDADGSLELNGYRETLEGLDGDAVIDLCCDLQSGDFSVALKQEELSLSFDAQVKIQSAEVSFLALDAANALDATTLDGDAISRLQQELQPIVVGLMKYAGGIGLSAFNAAA